MDWGATGDSGSTFKFNFSVGAEETEAKENISIADEDNGQAPMLPAAEVHIDLKELPQTVWAHSIHKEPIKFRQGFHLYKGRMEDSDSIMKLSGTDLVAGQYGGGLKLWECSLDLVEYLHDQVDASSAYLQGRRVLELGCGHALPAIFCALHSAAHVALQDYNEEVLRTITAFNVAANLEEAASLVEEANPGQAGAGDQVWPKTRYISGDWGDMERLLCDPGYDIILTAETIYSTQSQARLFKLIKQCLRKPHGLALVAAKTYYFGVGGGTRSFESLVQADGQMNVEVVASFRDGASNVREILQLTFKDQ